MADPEDYCEVHESREELRETHATHYEEECPIGQKYGCPHFHIQYHKDYYGEVDVEYWCNHPDLDQEIMDEYCPLIVEEILEEMEEAK